MAEPAGRPLRIIAFGTFDVRAHPRVAVLIEGLRAAGATVAVGNVPLGLDTSWRVRLVKEPWLLPVLAVRLLGAWTRLALRARRLRRALGGSPDAVLVGYMGHFDVHLARRLFPGVPLVLDHLISARDTAVDRGVGGSRVGRLLQGLDAAAVRAADIVVVDTEEHLELLLPEALPRAVVVPVGAPAAWFADPAPRPADAPLRVVFFGLFTPLQGATVLGAALRRLAEGGWPVEVTMVGHGQDLPAARAAAGDNPRVRWLTWVDSERLPRLVAEHDVCLGIFDTGAKARRVVPNKVFQGAAAGCAIVTGDTPPQRAALDEAACYVPPGDAAALAEALASLARDRARVEQLRRAASARARACFSPEASVRPLLARLRPLVEAAEPHGSGPAGARGPGPPASGRDE